MAVAQLCRKAGGIAGDSSLTGEVQAAAGHRAGVHGKAKLDVYKRQLLGGAKPWYYPLTKEHGFLPYVKDIPEDVARKAKYMIVSLPANPVGSVEMCIRDR